MGKNIIYLVKYISSVAVIFLVHSSSAPFNHLPKEILAIITLELSFEEQKNLSLVSKAINGASENVWMMSIDNFFDPHHHKNKASNTSYLAFFHKELKNLAKNNAKYLKENGYPNNDTRQGHYLAGVNLSELLKDCNELKNLDFSNTNLQGANLSMITLSASKFCHADLSNALLSQSAFWGCDFSEAKLVGADISWTQLSRSIFEKSDLSKANLQGSVLDSTKLNGAIFKKCFFGNFTEWKNVDITGVTFHNNSELISHNYKDSFGPPTLIFNIFQYLAKKGAKGEPIIIAD